MNDPIPKPRTCILTPENIDTEDDCSTHDHELPDPDAEVIRIVFTVEDVEQIADDNDIPLNVALDRAWDWATDIASTATSLCDEQLTNAIVDNTP